jgi:hypothetical protein
MGGESSLYGVKKYIQHFGKEKSWRNEATWKIQV